MDMSIAKQTLTCLGTTITTMDRLLDATSKGEFSPKLLYNLEAVPDLVKLSGDEDY